MSIGAYVANCFFSYGIGNGDDTRVLVPPGGIVLLDSNQAAAATAAGTISGSATLSGGQTTTLANMQGSSAATLGCRAAIVLALGLT